MKQYKKILAKIAGNKVLKKVTLLLCVFCVLLIFAGISYSFFKGAVSGGSGKEVKASTANLSILFTDSDVINVTDMFPGESVTKTFSVTNTGDQPVYYCIYYENVVNNLGDPNDFYYSISKTGESGEPYQNYFPTTSYNSEPYPIVCSSIDAGVTDSYTLTINFEDDPSQNQDDNRGKTISAKLTLQEDYTYGEPEYQYLASRIITESPSTTGTVSPDGLAIVQQPASLAAQKGFEYRFTGSDPHNYINVGGETWRIVGFENDVASYFPGEKRIKIVKDDLLSAEQWMSTRSTLSWDNSSLASYLNGEDTPLFSSSSDTHLPLSSVYLYQNPTSNSNTASSQYAAERNYEIPIETSRSASGRRHWIGLLSPSDYVYASSACYSTNTTLSNYSNANCKNSNWLYSGQNEWLLNANSDNSGQVNYITSAGAVSSMSATSSLKYRPVAYLYWDTYIVSGDGDTPETAYNVDYYREPIIIK